MPIKVNLPDGRVVNFPDSMSAPDIQAAMRKLTSGTPPAPATPADGPGARPATFRNASPITSAALDVAGGLRSSAANVVFQGGDLIRRGFNAVAPDSLDVERVIERPAVQAGITAPPSAAGQIGRFVGDAAQVLTPMGAVSRATQGARLGTRMAAEGGAMATITAAQGGDPVTAGVIGAAIPGVGAAARSLPASLRESAQKKVAQALGATKERFKAIAEKRAPEILARGLGGSRAALLADATAHAKEAGQAVDDVLTAAGAQRVPTTPVIDALEEAKSAFQRVRRVPMSEAVKTGLVRTPGAKVSGQFVDVPVVLDARPIEQLTKLQQTIRELGDDASVEHLTAARRVWDDVVARAGGFAHRSGSQFGVPLAEQTEAWAKREATKAIRKVLAEDVPDLAKVNAEFAFWKDLKDVLTATQQRTQAQGPGLQRIVYGTVGAGAGYSSGDDVGDRLKNAVIGGIIAPKLLSGLTSAQWRLIDARLRNRLADAIASEAPGKILGAVAQIAAVSGSKAATPGPTTTATTGSP